MICMIKIPYMHLYKNNNETLHFVWLYTPIKKSFCIIESNSSCVYWKRMWMSTEGMQRWLEGKHYPQQV
jgi:hypothetical protein